MSIQSREDELFAEWSRSRPDFVKDGVVDEQAYLSSSPKLLLVLKEVNDPGGGGWDLREVLREAVRKPTWDNVTRWIEGLQALPEHIDWENLNEIEQKRRRKALRSIVAVNLKKSPGGHTSDPVAVEEAAKKDKAFFNRQFQLYKPDFVICCGTSDLFHKIVLFPTEPDWCRTKRGVWFHEYEKGRRVIAFSHPGARCAPYLLHYGLIDAVREIQNM